MTESDEPCGKRVEVSKPMTIRFRSSAEKDILDIMKNEGFSTRADLLNYVTRVFKADVLDKILGSADSFIGDEGKYRQFLESLADRYKRYYDGRYSGDDVKESFTVSFRFSDELYEVVREFNNGTLRYRNIQEFVRVAFGWYVGVKTTSELCLCIRDLWKNDILQKYR